MTMTRVSRRVLMTMAVLALVVSVGSTLALLGCGSSGGNSEPAGLAEDIVLFPGGADDAKSDALVESKLDPNTPGINLGDNGRFYSLDVGEGFVNNHYFMTKANVSYQVEAIAEGVDADVDLYIGRSSHPYSDGDWKSSTRVYPLMDGIVFKSTQDGIMYVDVRGFDGDSKGVPHISYRIHVRKCQFGTFSQ